MMRIVLDAGYRGYVGIEYEGDALHEPDGIRATKALLERVRAELAPHYGWGRGTGSTHRRVIVGCRSSGSSASERPVNGRPAVASATVRSPSGRFRGLLSRRAQGAAPHRAPLQRHR
jgi:hypothetical protein